MKVAITGSIGSGKSTVCEMIARRGFPMCSADAINGELLRDKDIQDEVVRRLGLEKFSKEAIAYAIFRDNHLRQELDDYLHPLILEKVHEFWEEHHDEDTFVEVPLLYEVGWEKYFDYTVTVLTDPVIAEQRLSEYRDMPASEARRRRLQQLAQEDKARKSDYTISNNGDIDALARQVDQLLIVIQEKDEEERV